MKGGEVVEWQSEWAEIYEKLPAWNFTHRWKRKQFSSDRKSFAFVDVLVEKTQQYYRK